MAARRRAPRSSWASSRPSCAQSPAAAATRSSSCRLLAASASHAASRGQPVKSASCATSSDSACATSESPVAQQVGRDLRRRVVDGCDLGAREPPGDPAAVLRASQPHQDAPGRRALLVVGERGPRVLAGALERRLDPTRPAVAGQGEPVALAVLPQPHQRGRQQRQHTGVAGPSAPRSRRPRRARRTGPTSRAGSVTMRRRSSADGGPTSTVAGPADAGQRRVLGQPSVEVGAQRDDHPRRLTRAGRPGSASSAATESRSARLTWSPHALSAWSRTSRSGWSASAARSVRHRVVVRDHHPRPSSCSEPLTAPSASRAAARRAGATTCPRRTGRPAPAAGGPPASPRAPRPVAHDRRRAPASVTS